MKQYYRISGVLSIILLLVGTHVFADEIVTDYSKVPQHIRSVLRVTSFDPRVQKYGWEANVDLEPLTQKPILGRGYSGRSPRGAARFAATLSPAYNPSGIQGGVTLKVRELAPTYNQDNRYEVWLVDEKDKYWLSLGLFGTDEFGNGRFNPASPVNGLPAMQKILHPVDLYDAIAVTLEPLPDNDPRPSDKIVLYGKIPKPNAVTLEPTVQQKLQGVHKYYATSAYGNPSASLPKTTVKVSAPTTQSPKTGPEWYR